MHANFKITTHNYPQPPSARFHTVVYVCPILYGYTLCACSSQPGCCGQSRPPTLNITQRTDGRFGFEGGGVGPTTRRSRQRSGYKQFLFFAVCVKEFIFCKIALKIIGLLLLIHILCTLQQLIYKLDKILIKFSVTWKFCIYFSDWRKHQHTSEIKFKWIILKWKV